VSSSSGTATLARIHFEKAFHARTLSYMPGYRDEGRQVTVLIGGDAHNPAGHVLASTLLNQLARAHRRIAVIGDLDRKLECSSPFAAQTIGDATVGTARAINPYIEVAAAEKITAASEKDSLILGIGAAAGAHVYLGADGFIAEIGANATISERPASDWGALLASCLAADVAFHWAINGEVRTFSGRYSLWELGKPGGKDGPEHPDLLDVGRVLQVGAGAVGCALDLAGTLVGLGGQWAIVDGDLVEVSNLNRQSLFVASDAGWPTGAAANKALTVSRRMRASTGAEITAAAGWYDAEPDILNGSYDVVLALANDRGVRGALQGRQPTVLLHATTSASWQAQVHRHVAGHDDCINCRIPSQAAAMRCSTGEVDVVGDTTDAALPFLSMTAGVLLAAQLSRLQHGEILQTRANQGYIDLREATPLHAEVIRRCRASCHTRLPPAIQQTFDAHSRWCHLHGMA
jgi:molybdopterin/thiamine biosynthesis adenylyltransferase